jgi:hypothetical protein
MHVELHFGVVPSENLLEHPEGLFDYPISQYPNQKLKSDASGPVCALLITQKEYQQIS